MRTKDREGDTSFPAANREASSTDKLTEVIIGAAIEVHRNTGPGLLESAYEECLCRELSLRRLPWERQREIPFVYKCLEIGNGYRLDLLVAERVVVEIKATDAILPIHEAQVLTYLRLGGWRIGLILNFHVPIMKDGVRRPDHVVAKMPDLVFSLFSLCPLSALCVLCGSVFISGCRGSWRGSGRGDPPSTGSRDRSGGDRRRTHRRDPAREALRLRPDGDFYLPRRSSRRPTPG